MSDAADGSGWDKLSEKQQRVLNAAMEVFAEKGYAGASTAEIAKRAGVAEGTVFKTYKTKKDLLLGVVAPFFARVIAPKLMAEVRAIVNAPHASFEDFLRALYRNRIGFIRSHVRLARIAMQEVPFHDEIRELVKQTMTRSMLPDMLALIERFQRQGEIRADADPLSIIRLMAGTFLAYGVSIVLIAPDRAWDDDAEVELMARFVARGLRP